MRKEASITLWKELYQVALELKALEPWKYFWDCDLVSIELQESGEDVFCSIMGSGGNYYGVGVYEGVEGLEDFEILTSMEKLGLPFEYVMFEQSSLSCCFGDREDVPPEQKKLIRELGYKFRGKGEWLYFESFKKRYAPYIPDEREVKVLLETFKGLIMAFVSVVYRGLKVDFEHGEMVRRVYNKERDEWQNFAIPYPKIQKNFPKVTFRDDTVKKRLKGLKKSNTELVIDIAYMNTRVQEIGHDRPVNPLLFIALDGNSGTIIELDYLQMDTNEIDKILQFFILYVEKNGLMKVIRARNPWVLAALKDICKYCEIRLEQDSLYELDDMLHEIKSSVIP